MENQEFKNMVWEAMGRTFDEYPKWLVIEFCDYWTEMNPNGRKMRWEKQKTFDIKRRLLQWKRNSKKFNPDQWPVEEISFKNFFSRQFMKSLDMNARIKYLKHLEECGYKYVEGSHGHSSHLRDPENKIIWI